MRAHVWGTRVAVRLGATAVGHPGASPGGVGFCAFGVDLCALGVGFCAFDVDLYAFGVGFYALTGRDHVGVVPVMRHRAR